MRYLLLLCLLPTALGGCKGGSTPVRNGGDAAVDSPGGDDAPSASDGGDAGDASDPCASLCGPNATCAPDGGASDASGACVCKPGFTGDGVTCTDVAAGLSGLRWELPCGADLGGNVCAATTTMTMTMVKGAAGTTYAVGLHFRGVIEQKTYTGGTIDGSWVAGGTPAGDAFNVYKLEISSPPQVFYLNAGASSIYNCFLIDYQKTIDMDAGATVTLLADVVDGHEIENVDPAGKPIIVDGVPPAPGAYNGQFIQMDVDSVAAK